MPLTSAAADHANPRLFFLAGEASGDMHAARVVYALKALHPGVQCVGMGGPEMAAAGVALLKDLQGMQVVGFVEVLKQYGFFKRVFYALLEDLKRIRPAALICVDYPGFNLRFAAEARKLGIPCLYYIVPQVWAWKPKRAERMAHTFERAFCVFDFERPFFERYASADSSLQTQFVGHPLVDRSQIKVARIPELAAISGQPTVCFLPGSRSNEIALHLPAMLKACALYRQRHGKLTALFSLPEQTSVEMLRLSASFCGLNESAFSQQKGKRVLKSVSPGEAQVLAIPGAHSAILPAHADFGVIKSGTSTLEAGLQGNPLCCLYKGSWLSYLIAHQLVDIPVFSLINIVLGRYAVPELLQGEVNAERLCAEIERGLHDQDYIQRQRAALAELPARLGGPGCASRTAEGILSFLRTRGE